MKTSTLSEWAAAGAAVNALVFLWVAADLLGRGSYQAATGLFVAAAWAGIAAALFLRLAFLHRAAEWFRSQRKAGA